MSKSTISTFQLFVMFPDQETARTYLDFLGSSLYQVMQTCQTAAAPAVYSVPLAALPIWLRSYDAK